MKHSELSHCSDECLLADIKASEPIEDKGAESWKEDTDPWK
ncbi:hypothetical protein [Nitrosopumilus sp. b3]|nr:hypothetical protein [Nitrosopumilus sp. b3]